MRCLGLVETLNLPMMLCTGTSPRGVVATKSSDSIYAPSFCRTWRIIFSVFLWPGDPGQRSPKPAISAVYADAC